MEYRKTNLVQFLHNFKTFILAFSKTFHSKRRILSWKGWMQKPKMHHKSSAHGKWDNKLGTKEINEAKQKQRKQNNLTGSVISGDPCTSFHCESGHKVTTDHIHHKIEIELTFLRAKQLQLLDDVQSNAIAGETIITLLREFATDNEVDKVLLHISEVESVTHLLVLLTRRLARIEEEKKNVSVKKKEEKLLCQLKEARRLRHLRYTRGNKVDQIFLKYFNADFQFHFECFLNTKVRQIIDLRQLEDKIRLFEQSLAELETKLDMSGKLNNDDNNNNDAEQLSS